MYVFVNRNETSWQGRGAQTMLCKSGTMPRARWYVRSRSPRSTSKALSSTPRSTRISAVSWQAAVGPARLRSWRQPTVGWAWQLHYFKPCPSQQPTLPKLGSSSHHEGPWWSYFQTHLSNFTVIDKFCLHWDKLPVLVIVAFSDDTGIETCTSTHFHVFDFLLLFYDTRWQTMGNTELWEVDLFQSTGGEPKQRYTYAVTMLMRVCRLLL
jgi:hypothetical protein